MPFSSDDQLAWLGDFLKRRGLPGMAVAVTNREGEYEFLAKGWAELRKRPIEEDTLFELGSIGKTFTAVITLQLADEGLSLDAPVTDYLPWFEVRSEFAPIAIEHLLLHSAGLIRGTEVTADSRFDVWALRDTQTGFAPGERHYYSNVGYRTLGYALETATGVPYSELLRARILEPIGLEHTVPEITVDIRDRMAVGYDRLHDDRTPVPCRPAVPRGLARDGDGRRLPRLERRRIWRLSPVISLAGRRRHSPRARYSTRATGGATATDSSGREACSGTGGRCPASPLRCSATSTPAL